MKTEKLKNMIKMAIEYKKTNGETFIDMIKMGTG